MKDDNGTFGYLVLLAVLVSALALVVMFPWLLLVVIVLFGINLLK